MGVAEALQNIVHQLPYHLENLQDFTLDVTVRIVLPAAGVLTLTVILWKISLVTSRIIFPPKAPVLHMEALGLLKKRDDEGTLLQAERLLQWSIKRQPTYRPSYLSLASLQLYQRNVPDECLKTIDRALLVFPNDPDLLKLQLDAKAVEQNLGHMVKAGSITMPYLGDVPMRL